MGDDLHVEDPTTHPGAIRDATHDDFLDPIVLDLNGSLNGTPGNEPVDVDLETGSAFTGCPGPDPLLKFHDANGNGFWDNGEDIVLDQNGDGSFGQPIVNMGTPLPMAGGKYILDAKLHPKNGTISNYIPGQYYALTRVFVEADIENLSIWELFADCTDREDGINISKVNPDKVPGGAIVVLIQPNGYPVDLSDQMADDGTLYLTDSNGNGITDDAHAEDIGPVPAGSIVLFYVKFGPGLKGESVDLPLMCTNEEMVVADGIEDSVSAGLLLKEKGTPALVDLIIDADGIVSAGDGIPGAVDVIIGTPLQSFPVLGPATAGLDWFDNDNDGLWTFGPAGDDLHSEDPGTCPTALRDGDHDLGLDCKVLDLDNGLVDQQQVNCDLEVNVPFTEPHLSNGGCPSSINNIRYHDMDGDMSWDNGEDIVLDVNGNGVFD
jgi:hypothetical protein